jgi:hypothetical protein
VTVRRDHVAARLEGAIRHLQVGLEELVEVAKIEPTAVEQVVGALVSHLRSWRPESVCYLGELPPPESPNVDPRGQAA